jgi:hypothetical protein
MKVSPYSVGYALLWILEPLVLGIICFLMLRSRSRSQFPIFFAYCAFSAVTNIVLLAISIPKVYAEYFYAYWIASLLSSVLGLAVIREVFLEAFSALPGLRDLGRITFRWAAFITLMIAIVVGLNATHGYVGVILASVINLESSVRIIQVGLLLLLFVGSEHLGLSVRSRTFGIALGMGLAACSNLLVISIYPAFSAQHTLALNLVHSSMFLLTALVWTAYFALPAVETKPVPLAVASPLSRWNEAAIAFGYKGAKVLYPQSPEPFLPQVERIVNRVIDNQHRA